MSIGCNPTVIMADKDKISKTLKFISGISDGSGISSFNGCAEGSFNVNTVIIPPFGNNPEFRNDGSSDRPGKFCRAFFDSITAG